MPTPSNMTPSYNLTLPSTGKKIKYRPFLVKEEKILLMAEESEDEDQKINAVKQIIENCTYNKLDVEKLAMFDIEFIFLNIRMKSKGESTDLSFVCERDKVDSNGEPVLDKNGNKKHCGEIISVKYDLNDVKVEKQEGHTNKIQISDDTYVVMKYPGYETFSKIYSLVSTSTRTDAILKVIVNSIDSFVEGEKVYDEFTEDELVSWLEELTGDQFQKIENFYRTMPKLRGTLKFKCTCGKYDNEVNLEGLQSFLE